MTIQMKDPSAHAELLAIKLACKKLNVLNLLIVTLYNTEPCEMCQYLIIQTGVKSLFRSILDLIMKNKLKIKNNFLKKMNIMVN